MNEDLYNKTRELLSQLNYFIFHVIFYFILNIALVLAAFQDISSNWWVFFIVVFWAFGLILHGLKVYGINLFNQRDKRANILWAWLLKFTAG